MSDSKIKINFPPECEEYVNLQCNGDKSLYEDFPEHKHIDEYLKDMRPENVLDIGAGIGRASVWLFKKYGWDCADYFLVDGDSGNKQFEGIRKNSREYYNNWDCAHTFCEANGIDVYHRMCVDPEVLYSIDKKFDLIYSFLAFGFHWPIDMYMDDLYHLCKKNTILIFGLRGTEKKAWIEGQIEKIDPKKYKVLKLVHKPTQTRESVLVLCPVNL